MRGPGQTRIHITISIWANMVWSPSMFMNLSSTIPTSLMRIQTVFLDLPQTSQADQTKLPPQTFALTVLCLECPSSMYPYGFFLISLGLCLKVIISCSYDIK